MVGKIHGIDIRPEDTTVLRQEMKTMRAHRDSKEGLQLLMWALHGHPNQFTADTRGKDTAGKRRPRSLLRGAIQCRELSSLQACAIDLSFRRRGTGCCPGRLLHGRDTRLGHHRWTSSRHGGRLVTRPGNAVLPIPGLPQPNAIGATLPDLARDMICQLR
jgi:2-haloacid dehalogenase